MRLSAIAGLEPKGINPYTKKVMEEAEIDISNQYSKNVKDFIGKLHFGYLITVCSEAKNNVLYFLV